MSIGRLPESEIVAGSILSCGDDGIEGKARWSVGGTESTIQGCLCDSSKRLNPTRPGHLGIQICGVFPPLVREKTQSRRTYCKCSLVSLGIFRFRRSGPRNKSPLVPQSCAARAFVARFGCTHKTQLSGLVSDIIDFIGPSASSICAAAVVR